LQAGIFEPGKGFTPTEEGTPQGGVITIVERSHSGGYRSEGSEAGGYPDQPGECSGAAVWWPGDDRRHGRCVQDRHGGQVFEQVGAAGFGHDHGGAAERDQLEELRLVAFGGGPRSARTGGGAERTTAGRPALLRSIGFRTGPSPPHYGWPPFRSPRSGANHRRRAGGNQSHREPAPRPGDTLKQPTGMAHHAVAALLHKSSWRTRSHGPRHLTQGLVDGPALGRSPNRHFAFGR
jgi:hypothetical protein